MASPFWPAMERPSRAHSIVPCALSPCAGWRTVGVMSSPRLLARPGPLAALSAPGPRGAGAPLWPGPPDLDGALSGACRAPTLAVPPRRAARPGVGGLRQRAHPGPPARPAVPGPLYASRGHLQPPPHGPGQRPGDLPLQGLPARPSPAHPDAGGRRVLTASAAARAPTRLPQDTALRRLGQPGTAGEARAVPHSPG